MSENQLKFSCKIYLEAEDVSQSRILSTASYVRNLLKNSGNPCIARLEIDDESDMDDFTLRLYIESEIEETGFSEPQAEMLAPQIAEILSEIAQAQSYLDMEGSFSVKYGDNSEAYRFISESGNAFCDFEEQTE